MQQRLTLEEPSTQDAEDATYAVVTDFLIGFQRLHDAVRDCARVDGADSDRLRLAMYEAATALEAIQTGAGDALMRLCDPLTNVVSDLAKLRANKLRAVAQSDAPTMLWIDPCSREATALALELAALPRCKSDAERLRSVRDRIRNIRRIGVDAT